MFGRAKEGVWIPLPASPHFRKARALMRSARRCGIASRTITPAFFEREARRRMWVTAPTALLIGGTVNVMNKSFNLLVGLAMLNLSGCMLIHGEKGSSYDHGDRIDRDGTRYVGWCDARPRNTHCLQGSTSP